MYRAMETVVRIATGTGSREQADQRNRHWQSINHPTCYGRFVADTEEMRTCVMDHTEFPNAVKRSNGGCYTLQPKR